MLKKDKSIKSFFPLHNRERLQELSDEWLHLLAYPWEQPLWDIKEYFGEKIGLYFAFLGHYTTMLLYPAATGFLIFLHVVITLDTSAESVPFFALFVSFWSILMLELWKRKEVTLRLEWGMVGFEEEEKDRPEFNGERIKSFVDGKDLLYFPPDEKAKLVAQSVGVVSGMIAVVMVAVGAIFFFRFWMVNDKSAKSWGPDYGPIIGSVLNAVTIQLLNFIYGRIAKGLSDRENHRTDTEYEDALISKLFNFQVHICNDSLSFAHFSCSID